MYLVYLSVGHDPFFVKMVDICVNSILATTDNSKIEICVMCDSEYQQYLSHLPVKIHLTDKSLTAMSSSMRKVEVFNIENIHDYERVLFLDGDIIVTKSLIPLFEAASDPSKFYVFKEHYKHQHSHIFFSLLKYTQEELNYLNDNNIVGFNCGQFLFAPTLEMKEHFNNVVNSMTNYKGEYFYEQSFMNVYFNKRHTMLNNTLLNEYVHLFPIDDVLYEDKSIIHFAGLLPGQTIRDKYDKMVRYLKFANILQ